MAKKRKLKTPSRRNLVVLALIARKGAGAGRHKSKRREMQVPRKAKYKSLYRPPPLLPLKLNWPSTGVVTRRVRFKSAQGLHFILQV